MQILLTSFGLSHVPRRAEARPDAFYRMPPVSISQMTRDFMPDYSVLLLAEQIILDSNTYERPLSGRNRAYGTVALMIRMLHDEGFVRLEDFDAIVQEHRSLLEAVLEKDLRDLDGWVPALRESFAAWRGFLESMRESRLSHHTGMDVHMAEFYAADFYHLIGEGFESSEMGKQAEHRQALREALAEYLSYVNANLLLCHSLQCGFHDWCDFQPFYRDKFLTIARESGPGAREIESMKRLFEVSFPEFTFWHPDNIIRALKDRRIRELRAVVDKAVRGELTLDREFAVRVLKEVLKIERSIVRLRNIVSWATMPLGFIPVVGTPVQKALEEGIVQPVASRRRREFRWFYFISELAERSPSGGSEPAPG